MFTGVRRSIANWIAPSTMEPAPSSGQQSSARLAALIMMPSTDVRHQYLDARAGSQDIRYQIASDLGISLKQLKTAENPSGLVAFYGYDGPDNQVDVEINLRASHLLNTRIWGPCYFLHRSNGSSVCDYSDARPELLQLPKDMPAPLIQQHAPLLTPSPQNVLDLVNDFGTSPESRNRPLPEERAVPGPMAQSFEQESQLNLVQEDNRAQWPTSLQSQESVAQTEQPRTIRKMDNADNKSDMFYPTPNMGHNNNKERNDHMPESPQRDHNNNNTLSPQRLVDLAHRLGFPTPTQEDLQTIMEMERDAGIRVTDCESLPSIEEEELDDDHPAPRARDVHDVEVSPAPKARERPVTGSKRLRAEPTPRMAPSPATPRLPADSIRKVRRSTRLAGKKRTKYSGFQ